MPLIVLRNLSLRPQSLPIRFAVAANACKSEDASFPAVHFTRAAKFLLLRFRRVVIARLRERATRLLNLLFLRRISILYLFEPRRSAGQAILYINIPEQFRNLDHRGVVSRDISNRSRGQSKAE